MQAIGNEAIEKAGQRQPRRCDVGVGNQAIQAELAGERLELERLTGGHEVTKSHWDSRADVTALRGVSPASFELPAELAFHRVQRAPEVDAFCGGDDRRGTHRTVQPHLHAVIACCMVEDCGCFHESGAEAPKAIQHRVSALAQRLIKDYFMTGGDGDLHSTPLQLFVKDGGGKSPRARSNRCASTCPAAACQVCVSACCLAAWPSRTTRSASRASRSIARDSAAGSP